MKLLTYAFCGSLMLAGCASSQSPNSDDTSTQVLEMHGRRLSAADVRVDIRKSDAGDGAAAFALYSHYLLGDPNTRLSQKYFERALELENPPPFLSS
jgi:outer membrane murein-binding lipoprotein Lpp